MFSEMLSYWLCVIHIAENGQITTIQGVITNWTVMKYASSNELEERFRYSSNNSHWSITTTTKKTQGNSKKGL